MSSNQEWIEIATGAMVRVEGQGWAASTVWVLSIALSKLVV